MRRYTEEPGKRMTAFELGLGGVELFWRFENPVQMQRAVMYLMKCHPHHFAVLPDQDYSLAISTLAAKCLRKAIDEGKLVL